MNQRASFYLIVLVLTVLAIGPSDGSGREPMEFEKLVCVPTDAFLLHIKYLTPPWIGCAIAEDLDPVGTDLPIVWGTQATQRRAQAEAWSANDGADTDRSPISLVNQYGAGSESSHSGIKNIGKL